ncbi:MAG: preprotein translocase subunit SecG [Flavobacteriales bacterium]|nr:preprotein translocase subunit SecG [Flavobacteriales bacterium]HRE97684.1 preprotein translocase subunit SecG [Flavobacteriales bacterium]HRJ38354.1 preprotein translocase subunit SecG [Flavobacteriales bacterium]
MSTFFVILLIIICVLLVAIVLIQNPKGGGINSGITGAGQILGVKQQTDVVEKWTWYLAIGLVVLCLFSAPLMSGGGGQTQDDTLETQVPVSGNIPTNFGPTPPNQ